MGFRKVLVQSRKLPAQHIEALWEHIYRHNLKLETLSSILAFYLHHRVYPPPVQKAFDMLLLAFTDPKVSKKMKVMLFQTVEEMCHWLSPTCISDTVRLSSSPNLIVDLLPCFLINKTMALPEIPVYERLISSLTNPGLLQEDRCKVLGFLMATLPGNLRTMLNKQLIAWLSYSRTPQTSSLFKSADVTEVDGSPSVGICTALTLVMTVTDLHMLSLVSFSNMRLYLSRCEDSVDGNLNNSVLSYCTTLLAQAAKNTSSTHDKHLISAILEEVLQLMKTVKELDSSCKGRCQLIVQNVQLLAEQMKLSPILVSVWEYQLTQGVDSPLTQKMLSTVIKREFSQGLVSQKIAGVITDHGSKLALSLAEHVPNLLKLVATHPSGLVEEFMHIVPLLGKDKKLTVEVLHSLLDLPVLSASICVHQSVLLTQAGIKVPSLLSARKLVDADPSNKKVFNHFMRTQAVKDQTEPLLKLYFNYWSALRSVLSLSLVEICSQVTPLLLGVFLDAVTKSEEANKLLLPTLLNRIPLLCPLPMYQNAVFDLIPQYINKMCSQQPLLAENTSVMQFLSVVTNCQLCPQIFDSLVAAVGDYVQSEEVVINTFEVLDASLREIIADKTFQDSKLKSSICTSLAKLASRQTMLIPRAISAFEKLNRTVQSSKLEEKDFLTQQAKELIRLLKNPGVAGVVLSPETREDIALAALVRVLFQFLD